MRQQREIKSRRDIKKRSKREIEENTEEKKRRGEGME